jgi:succinate dehydrogenase / fumarate reductase membrane anchor subunit
MKESKRSHLTDAEKGTGHWRWQRISALLLIPLSIWLIVSFSNVVYNEYQRSLAWVSAPLPGSLLGITLISLLFHGHLGIVVIIDDYVRGPWRRRAIQISAFLTAFVGLFAITAIVAILITE